MKWSVDNLYRAGEIMPGRYALLRDGHEIAYGLDRPELENLARLINLATPEQVHQAIMGDAA
jgi:hypothetical protein